MRYAILCLFILSCSLFVSAQYYANEWIEHDQTYLKINITSDGIYRADAATVEAELDSAGYLLSSIDPRNIQLFHNGEEQYIHIEGENDGIFNSSDFIEFYANKNDGSFDTLLFEDPDLMLHQAISLFNDTAAYYLTWNNSTSNLRIENRVNNLSGAPAADLYIRWNEEVFYNNYAFFSQGPPIGEVQSSQYTDGEGFTDAIFNKSSVDRTLFTSSIYSPLVMSNTCRITLVGKGSVPHRSVIDINSTNYVDESWSGYSVRRHEFALTNLIGSNKFEFTAAGTGSSDQQQISLLSINYAREPYLGGGAKRVHFNANEKFQTSRLLTLTGFSAGGTPPILYDLTKNKRILGILSSDTVRFHLDYDATNSEFFISNATSTYIRSVNNMNEVEFVDFSAAANQGNYVILTHPHFEETVGGINYIQAYADHRSSSAGGLWNVVKVDINQLYEQFSYGIRKHPLAIRHFSHYITEQFDNPAEHLFMIGKGRVYNDYRQYSTYYDVTWIPTYGHPGSDLLLASKRGEFQPVISIGRLAAREADDVRIYYEKMVEFDARQQSLLQTIDNKFWMKNILHFGGGISEFEQTTFRAYLEDYEDIVQDTSYGGNVFDFYKTSTDPITTSPSDKIDSLLQAGVSLMTFFGHSSINTFDYNIGDPANFANEGKYPLVYGNGCVTGDIHKSIYSLSENYVFAEGKAAIGFLAASTLSYAGGLDVLAEEVYTQLATGSYDEAIGINVNKAIAKLASSSNILTELAIEHLTLHGDPALKLNTHPKPDYAIEAPFVVFDPPVVSLAVDSFTVNVIIHNLGHSIDSAYFVQIRRFLPDGSEEELKKRVPSAIYKDTVSFTFATDPINGVGLNNLDIRIDEQSEIEEIDEFNNILSVDVLIASDDAVPIWPYNFSIISDVSVHLQASTADAFAPVRQYVMQIDTSELFSSPLLQSRTFIQGGGVLSWNDPGIPMIDSAVYYWRVSLDTLYDNVHKWRGHSFVFIPDYSPGWNQSHYYQYLQDDFVNIDLGPDRVFDFVNDVRVVDIFTGGAWYEVVSYIDNAQIALSSCAGTGFVTFVFDPATGIPWLSRNTGGNKGPWGDYYCSSQPTQKIIQWRTDVPAEREALFNFMMDSIPEGFYFIAYTPVGEPNYANWLTNYYGPDSLNLADAFASYGSEAITGFDTLSYRPAFAFFGRKGYPEVAQESYSAFANESIQATFDIPGFWREGLFTTPQIGPAAAWNQLLWNSTSRDAIPTDVQSLSIYGIRNNGTEELIASGVTAADTSLSWIDQQEFPKIRLQLDAADDSLRTPTQLNYWRVLFDPVPEAALNPHGHFVISEDTFAQGQEFKLEIAIDNISEFDMDSLLIRYQVITQNNFPLDLEYPRQDSLLNGDRLISKLTLDSKDIPAGNNLLFIDVNPNKDQAEQSHFNNVGIIPFRVSSDQVNPYMDVTFDGIHILDGDLVSAEPEISIKLTDENPFLALNDTTHLDISLTWPTGQVFDINYNDPTLKFFPADPDELGESNSAEILISPDFELDGIYKLQVHGEDASGSEAGDLDYNITFEVINQSMISNVVNYPNPFTTHTHFVFTLTGSDVPDYFKIQIMTVSGKIIREINHTELGPLHVGVNKTEYTWDGTDKFGDPVGNGVYLYRVVTRISGQLIDHYETSADRYFKSGFGKMYLAR